MAHLSEKDRRRMERAYRLDVACFLAKTAHSQEKITYSALTNEFGGTDRGWGDVLGGIAIRCRKHNLPLLSVLVVAKATGLPSIDAVQYEDLGLKTELDIRAEQARCHAFDWASTPLWK
jgi:hypothetical protein